MYSTFKIHSPLIEQIIFFSISLSEFIIFIFEACKIDRNLLGFWNSVIKK